MNNLINRFISISILAAMPLTMIGVRAATSQVGYQEKCDDPDTSSFTSVTPTYKVDSKLATDYSLYFDNSSRTVILDGLNDGCYLVLTDTKDEFRQISRLEFNGEEVPRNLLLLPAARKHDEKRYDYCMQDPEKFVINAFGTKIIGKTEIEQVSSMAAQAEIPICDLVISLRSVQVFLSAGSEKILIEVVDGVAFTEVK